MQLFQESAAAGAHSLTVTAAQLHRLVHAALPALAPARPAPACCAAMRAQMQRDDRVLFEPPKGNASTLSILYRLPRGVPSAHASRHARARARRRAGPASPLP